MNLMFADCCNDVEKNQYKSSGNLKREFIDKNKHENFDFYMAQRTKEFTKVFDTICSNIRIPNKINHFVYFIDEQYLFDTTRGYRFENLTIDYDKILRGGLRSLKYESNDIDNQFCKDYNSIVDSIIRLSKRISDKLSDYSVSVYFGNMPDSEPKNLEDALQRILFVNQLFWQMGFRLLGLGRLDKLLERFYVYDKKNGQRDEVVLNLLKEFLSTLHQYYWLKSNVLMGDTGQIIILGGTTIGGRYFNNKLTELFIDAVRILHLPDPKILLRVGSSMPRHLMEHAINCMNTGIGSPLLSNDDRIIPCLVNFGVRKEDAFDYGTSACWEPLIQGRSISLNNLTYLSYPKVLNHMLVRTPTYVLENLDDFMNEFYLHLKFEINRIQIFLDKIRFQYNPLLSVFIDGCFESKKDVSVGGARYSNYGITTVGLSNTVNTIINIKKYVYDEHKYTIAQVRDILDRNFSDEDDLLYSLKNADQYYGKDDVDIVRLTNDILKHTTLYTEKYRNYMGGKLKFGASAPSYIDAAKNFSATFDGRKKNEAFGVHISSERNNGYTEIINFAAALDYGENRFNGNVVDLVVSAHFINRNFNKFIDLLSVGIEIGFFQLQINVMDSKKLMDAQKNPKLHSNLIVRVWGFSAYFTELPTAYQDVIIKRAIENERRAL